MLQRGANKALRIAKRLYRRSLTADRVVTSLLVRHRNARLRSSRNSKSGHRPVVTFRVDHTIPRCAWLCTRHGHNYHFTLGEQVERIGNGIFEGVWAGPFGQLHGGETTFGFGAVERARSILFIIPKHPKEFMFVLRDRETGVDYVSASLCFCLKAGSATDDLIARLSDQLADSTNRATAAGAYRYDPLVVETERFTLWRFFYGNFRLAPSGLLRIEQPYLGRSFASYDEYRTFLRDQISEIIANGRDPARTTPLEPVVTVSRGYDSPAVAALAKDGGAAQAITLTVRVNGADDSGRAVAEALGMSIREFDHAIATEIPDLNNVLLTEEQVHRADEFFATAGMGDDLAFANFEPGLTSKSLFTGSFGDSIWGTNDPAPAHLPSSVPYGKSLTEFRLRVGFAQVPAPVIGGLFPASIGRLNEQRDMAAFSVGGRYDRPLPRRMAEEAGVPREIFGVKKNAANPNLPGSRKYWRRAVEQIMRRYS